MTTCNAGGWQTQLQQSYRLSVMVTFSLLLIFQYVMNINKLYIANVIVYCEYNIVYVRSSKVVRYT